MHELIEESVRKETLAQALVAKIKKTAKDCHDNKIGELTLNKEELLELLRTVVFSDPEAMELAKNKGLDMPVPTSEFTFKIIGGDQSVIFQPGKVNGVHFTAKGTKIVLGLGKVKPREFPIDSLELEIKNKYTSDGKRMDGQVALAGLSMSPDYPSGQIPGLPSFAASVADNVQGLVNWALFSNHIMTELYNTLVPVIAVNGPEHATTKVMGLQADINDAGLTMHFLRDIFTPTLTRSGIPQIKGYSHTKP